MWTPVRIGYAALLLIGLVGLAGQTSNARQPDGIKTRIKVSVPQDDAELYIEDKMTKATGKTREFETPELESEKEYVYSFKVVWQPNNYTTITRVKEVEFVPEAGKELLVDLTKDGEDKAVVRYVPTPDDIVEQMVKLAGIKDDDVVFEPGCGDGRITIAGVKAGAKRGVGIDIDPERIAESKENVKAAKLEDKVEIRQGDALDIKDLSDATVVFLYMGDEFNMLIRPILWKQLKPGTRIVSHRFVMGDWKPDRTINVTGEDGDEYEIHLWTVTEEVKKKAEAK